MSDFENLFFKKFSFDFQNDWLLPPLDVIHSEKLWQEEILSEIKTNLNSTKALLNDKGEDWQKHTSNINKAGFVIKFIKHFIQPEILTQAWCKFYEILHVFNFVSPNIEHFKSFHLCEAPGAFISALNYFLCLKHPSVAWEWMANTLNPYYEGHTVKNVVVDDRLLFPTLKYWYFGKDNTGDIMDLKFLQDICEDFNENKFNLITADGSFNCLDNPGEQEVTVSKLQFAELLIAMSVLAPSGCFVIKKFTFFECVTVCQLYFLNCVFNKVHVFKPFASKAGNSEVYVVCQGYKCFDDVKSYLKVLVEAYVLCEEKAIFPRSYIPESFMKQLFQCCKFFSKLQESAIKENLSMYASKTSDEICNEIKTLHAEMFLRKYPVTPLHDYSFRRLFKATKQVTSSFYYNTSSNFKYMYFRAVGESFENLSKTRTMSWCDIVLDVEKRIDACFPPSLKRSFQPFSWCSVWKEIPSRMKSKNYKNWIRSGKKILHIQNSKFCNPLILHLWNRISINSECNKSNGIPTLSYWDFGSLTSFLSECRNLKVCTVVPVFISPHQENENDPVLLHFIQLIPGIQVCNLNLESDESNICIENRIFFVNMTSCYSALHQENFTKSHMLELLSSLIKILKEGDMFLICVQSLLTRYTVGLLYILLSLFEKFISVLPSSVAPANCGHIWIFENFIKPPWTSRVVEHLETVLNIHLDKATEVLEIVPIAALCGGHFYDYVLKCNNNHMLQRLRSLIAVEKLLGSQCKNCDIKV